VQPAAVLGWRLRASPLGRARDRVFHVCASMDETVGKGVAEGKHVVTMQASCPAPRRW